MPSDYSQNGEPKDADKTPEEKEKIRQTLLYLKALRESGKAHTKRYMEGFENAWGYVIGEKRFPIPGNSAAKQAEKNMSRTVRNGMYAMMDHKVAFITDAEPRITMKTLQTIEESERQKLASVLVSECERLDWRADEYSAAWDAEVGSVGFTMFYKKTNELTGEAEICSRSVDPSRVYVNREADDKGIQGHRLRYVVFEDELSLAEIRRMWPDEGWKVKPQSYKCINDSEYEYVAKDDDEIVEAPGNEFIVTKDGKIIDQYATVTWGWERWPETREIWEEKQHNANQPGFFCPSCGSMFVTDEPICPDCSNDEEGDVEMEPVTVPDGESAKQMFRQKVHPFGRCIIGIPEQQILFYEGDNELPLERVFPLAMDYCYKKPRSFYGMSDYGMLKSNQKARDQNIGLLRDHLRYNAHPIIERPKSAEEWANATNAPGAQVAVDDEVVGLARVMDFGRFDYQGFQAAEVALERDAMQITGVDEILTGGSPGPESGEAIKTRQIARGKRIAKRLEFHNAYRTDYAAIVWELMTKLYTNERTFTVRGPANELQAIQMNVSELPYDVIVTVTADPDQVELDKQMGQNLGQFITSGNMFKKELLPFVNDILTGFGLEPYRAEAMQVKLKEFHDQMANEPPGPPPDPSKILVAMADIMKVAPTYVSYEQVQEGLANSGISPAPPDHAPNAQLQAAALQAGGHEPQPLPQALPPMAPPQPEPEMEGAMP